MEWVAREMPVSLRVIAVRAQVELVVMRELKLDLAGVPVSAAGVPEC